MFNALFGMPDPLSRHPAGRPSVVPPINVAVPVPVVLGVKLPALKFHWVITVAGPLAGPPAVNVNDSFWQKVSGLAGVMVAGEAGFTITLTVSCAEQPLASVPVTVYSVVVVATNSVLLVTPLFQV